jgi:hypothetical protein
MRRFLAASAAILLSWACGGGSGGGGSTGPAADGGATTPPVTDAGIPVADAGTQVPDAGIPPPDAGAPGDEGGTPTPDAGSTAPDGGLGGGPGPTPDAGTPVDECAGLSPGTVGMPVQLQLTNQDLIQGGSCQASDVDGTGHVAVRHFDDFTEATFTFFEQMTGAAVGTAAQAVARLIGQANGFMGEDCAGAGCFQEYAVYSPTGKQSFAAFGGQGDGSVTNNPVGGMIQKRFVDDGTSVTVWLDSIDPAGAIRWSVALPDLFSSDPAVNVAVDRAGKMLAIWQSTARFGANTWAGQWFDASGVPGQVFLASTGPAFCTEFCESPQGIPFERVGSGLFYNNGTRWSQIDSMATSFKAAPDWLNAHPQASLHMAHGGTAYAVLPAGAAAAGPCQQQIEIVAPSGKSCGTATFALTGGSCTTSEILVGYDGTVVQQVPLELEPPCTASGHQCNCTWHSWPGFFR